MAESSEWGKLNAGQVYGILAVDVDRALACSDLGKYEQIVMQAIRERSWGTSARRKRRGSPWPDPEPARIDLKALASELGVAWQRLYKARKWLVDARMIAQLDGGFTPNKNAVDWIDPASKSPILTPALVAYAARACTRGNDQINPPAFTPDCEPDSRGSVNGVHTLHGTPFTRKCEPDSRGSVNSHIERAGASEDPTGLESFSQTGEKERETEFRNEIISTPTRPAEDMGLVHEAARILASDLRTQALGQKLLQEHNLPGLIAIQGWRWVIAARKVLEPGISKSARNSIRWLTTTAGNVTESDLKAAVASSEPEKPVEYFVATRHRQPRRRDYPDLGPKGGQGK